MALYSCTVILAPNFRVYLDVDLFEFRHKDRRHNRIAIFTWTIVITMYLIKLTLWTIDARNVISDLNIYLVQSNDFSLAERKLRASQTSTKLSVVEDVLYAFQVRLVLFKPVRCVIIMGIPNRWFWGIL